MTHSVLGRMSSHMIIHRAKVCDNEEESEAEAQDYGEVRKPKRHSSSQGKGTPTLNSRNSGLMKSRRNQVSGGFSQSAMDLVHENRRRRGGVNILLRRPLGQQKDESELRVWEGRSLLTNHRSLRLDSLRSETPSPSKQASRLGCSA